MCLLIGKKSSGFVSENDIVVYKYVSRSDNGNYQTPFQNYPIEVNSILVGSTDNDDIIVENYNKYCINGGAIHACLSSKDKNFSEYICLKAIIPAGTEFWIQDDMKQVASRQLFITDEVINDERHTDMMEIYKQIYANAPCNKDRIHVGDILLSNGQMVSPFDNFDKEKVIGYVGYIHPETDKAVCISAKGVNLPFVTKYDIENSAHSSIDSDEVKDDYNGYEHTQGIANASDYDGDIFKAIEYCRTYKTDGTNEGEWYLPAIGEVIALSCNMMYINASIDIVGIGDKLECDWMWSSSQYKGLGSYSWYCNLDDGDYNYYWSSRNYSDQVRPLYAFITQA